MLSQFVIRSYSKIIEFCLWAFPIAVFLLFFRGQPAWFALILGLGAFIVCAFLFGGILVLMDIRQSLVDIRKSLVIKD